MSSAAQQFKEISENVENKSLTVDQAIERMKEIDFNQMDYQEILAITDSEWLPDDVSVAISKKWADRQNMLLDQIRAFLVLTPTVTKEQIEQFVQILQCPSTEYSFAIKNLVNTIATAGGTREFINPLTNHLISMTTDPPDNRTNTLYQIYEPDPNAYYTSSPIQLPSIILGLPDFLKIHVDSYQIGTPGKVGKNVGGLQSWVIEVSNDLHAKNWIQIDQRQNCLELRQENARLSFTPSVAYEGFFRYIKLISTGINHLGNLSLIIKDFDVSGPIIVSQE